MKSVNLNDKMYFYNLATIDAHLKTGIDVGRLVIRSYDWISLFVSKLEMFSVWMDRSRQRQALLNLDDHLLADIGLDRDTVIGESSKNFWQV
ncbi:MAG: DUF1127 domain-containing protein [SAR324 cluster bacterium]|nr:DUF1127 domain-containing protein [SAR324 cluster bacterium]